MLLIELEYILSLNPGSSVLTATVSSIRVQSVVGCTAALRTGRRGQAKVGTVAVVMGTLIGALLTGGVEHQDVQHQLQLALRT